ncbi:MAG: amino acid--tRNA ligase-related protein [Rectinemataceae bacterium]|nr:amino acid--tRNA ligase-related protein [Rectinemataceae bacterium]
MTIETMKARSRLVSLTREFFLSKDYLETDTPSLSPALIPEACLEAFATSFVHPYRTGFPLYLVPSPEVWMKRIIAMTGRSVFQLCKSFRNAESISRIHNPEFTMLEYYTIGATSSDNIGLTEELFEILATPGTPGISRPPFRHMTMAEAFAEYASLDLDSLMEREPLIEAARSKNLLINPQASWEDAFNVIFLSLVEPALPTDRPLVLDEYPSGIECLAKDIPGKPYKERWELYVKGIEIANCFTEMGDPDTVRRYFASQAIKKAESLVPHRIDSAYAEVFDKFPPCSGVAVGFDRLAMVLLGLDDIQEAISFPFSAFPSF